MHTDIMDNNVTVMGEKSRELYLFNFGLIPVFMAGHRGESAPAINTGINPKLNEYNSRDFSPSQ